MIVLALDTTTRAGSVAVLRDEVVLAERVSTGDVPHGRSLPGEVFQALEQAGVRSGEVELYAVASGPGAFTGLRIGIATVQGLAFAHGRPAIGISALEALASAARRQGDSSGSYIAVWMDAARGEIFTALYEDAGELRPIDPPSVGDPDAMLAAWRQLMDERAVTFVGDGAIHYEARIAAGLGRPSRIVRPTPPLAATIGRLAVAAAGASGPPHAIRPLYVRRPDAELARDRMVLKGTPGHD